MLVVSEVAATSIKMDLEKSLERLEATTTDFGIVQHSNLEVPNPSFHYSVDDSSRGLVSLARFSNKFQMNKVADVFLGYAEGALRSDGFFENYRSPTGVFGARDGSGPENIVCLKDCFGRTIWGLAEFADSSYSSRDRTRAEVLIGSALEWIDISKIDTEKSLAFFGIGLAKILNYEKEDRVIEMACEVGEKLYQLYKKHSDGDWRAYSDEITYCAARTSHAMMALGDVFGIEKFVNIGIVTMGMLNRYTFDKDGVFHPIGNGNPATNTTETAWLSKGKEMALYDAQSVEAGCAVEVLCLAERLRPGEGHGVRARDAFAWHDGKNSAGIKMVTDSGAVYDGITGPRSVNENCGAEPLVMYLNSGAAIRDMAT